MSTAWWREYRVLSVQEIAFIQDRIRSVEQDWFALQPIVGSPHLHGGYVYFYSENTLHFSDLGLLPDGDPMRILAEASERLRPERIELTLADGSHDDFLLRRGWTRAWRSEATHNCEVVLRYSGKSKERFDRKRREFHRRNRRFRCDLHPGPLTAQHRELVRRHIQSLDDDLTPFDRKNIEVVPDFLADSEYGITVNAFQRDELIGFAQGHIRYAPRLGIFSFCIAPGRMSQLSDCLYVALLEEIWQRHVEVCSLGVTIWRGLYRYKTKWGAKPLTGPYRYESWVRARHGG